MTLYPDLRLRKKTNSKLDHFEVAEDCHVADLFTIPAGYVTNFASVPRCLWSFLPPHGRMANAAVLHDFMYDTRYLEEELGLYRARLTADTIFLLAMTEDGVPAFQAMLVFLVLRAFAAKWWRL